MKITIVGAGYVGLPTAVMLGECTDNDVILCDIDEEKIKLLNQFQVPFHDPVIKDIFEEWKNGNAETITVS